MKDKFSVSKTECFELGRLEGLKEAFRELEEMTKHPDNTFINTYVKVRLKSINENIVNIEKIRRAFYESKDG